MNSRATVSSAMMSLRSAQKSNAGAAAYSRFINRPLGRFFAAVAFVAKLTPDQVTVISAMCTLSGIALIAVVPPTLGTSVLIVVLLILGYALDSADGQLARLRGGGSRRGEWLDHMFDALKIATIHLAVLVCWWRFYDLDTTMLLFPIGFQVVASVMFFGFVLTDLIRRTSPSPEPEQSPKYRLSPIYSLVVLPSDYGLLLLIFILLWLPAVFVPVYCVLTVANALLLAAGTVRWYRSLR